MTKLVQDERPILCELLKSIKDIELYPHKTSATQRKVASVVKALIRPSKYLFLDGIEDKLGEDELKLVTAAIMEHCEKFNCTLFVKSIKSEFWFKHANKVLSREKDLSYNFSTIVKENIKFVDFESKPEQDSELPHQDKLSA